MGKHVFWAIVNIPRLKCFHIAIAVNEKHIEHDGSDILSRSGNIGGESYLHTAQSLITKPPTPMMVGHITFIIFP